MEDSREMTQEPLLPGSKDEKSGQSKPRRKSILRVSMEIGSTEEEMTKRMKVSPKKVSFAADEEIRPIQVPEETPVLQKDQPSAQSVCCSLW